MPIFVTLLAVGGIQKLQNSLTNVASKGYGTVVAPDLPLIIGQIVQAVLGLLGVVFMVLTVYGGYLWLIARGDETQVEKAKETIKNGVIGLAIMLGAYAISSFVVGRIVNVTLVGGA